MKEFGRAFLMINHKIVS